VEASGPGPRRPPDPKDRLAARHAQLQKMMQELQEAEDVQVTFHLNNNKNNQCCGSGMLIPDTNFSIPDPGPKESASRIRIYIKEFKNF
jgi:hypothetical protein